MIRALLGSACVAVAGGCIFSPHSGYTSHPALQETRLDRIVTDPPDAVVGLFQPIHDAGLAHGASSPPAHAAPVRVREYETGRVVEYRWSQQRFGAWSALREEQYNLFLLRASFLHPGVFEDTAGLDGLASLYQRAHGHDPYTRYIDSAAAEEARRLLFTTGAPKVIGIMVRVNDAGDTVFLRMVAPVSPAAQAGLRQGMPVLAVRDSVVTGDSAFARFMRFMAADTSGPVRLTVGAPEGPRTVEMTRTTVDFPTVIVDSLGGAGYIAVVSFKANTVGGGSTYDEFRKALDATRGFPSTVIDLRANGGGSLGVTLRMCNEVMSGGVIIRLVQRRFGNGAPLRHEGVYRAHSGGRGEGREFVLLADEGSASASEIFIAALREGLNVPQVGTRTYGKGVGQYPFDTPGGGIALVTDGRVLTASGLDYNGTGLLPTHPSSSPPDAMLAQAVEVAVPAAVAELAKGAVSGAGDVRARAAVLDWNRRQALRGGVEEMVFPVDAGWNEE